MEMATELELSNISIVDLSKEDLQSRYFALSKAYAKLQLDLEEKSQQIYDNKRELMKLTALEGEYLSEIEALQSGERNECDRLKLKIQNLEDEKNDIHNDYSDRIENLEVGLFKKDEEIVKLQEELKLLSSLSNSECDKNNIEELQMKNADLTVRVGELTHEVMALNEQIGSYEKQNLLNQELINNLQERLNMLDENYNCKKEELNEAKVLIENLQEELVVLKTELDTAKCKPLQDGSQGNSLFAEVDDKRLELQERMAIMKSHYIEMKQERGKLLSQIAILNSNNALLCQRWETEAQDRTDDEERLEKSYRARITALEKQLAIYQEELAARQKIAGKNLDAGEIEFIENMLEEKNKQIEKIQKEYDSFSLTRVLLSLQLKKANEEMRNWRAKASKLESEAGELRAQVENLQLKSTPDIENVQTKLNRCPVCAKNKDRSLLQMRPSRPKLKDLYDSLSTNSNSFISEEQFISTIDCSRQIKKSLSKETEAIAPKSCTPSDTDSKENVETTQAVKSVNNNSKKVQFAADAVDNSDSNKGKLRKGGKIIHCKPMVLKKRC